MVMPHDNENLISYDYLTDCLHAWTYVLWVENNRDRINETCTVEDVEQELTRKLIDILNANAGLSRGQSLSEQSFVLFAYGTMPIDMVSHKAADVIMQSRPIESWRKNIVRNRYQALFALFEDALKQSLDKFGEQGTIDLISNSPRHIYANSNMAKVANTLKYFGWKSAIGLTTVADLIRRIEKPETPNARSMP